MHGQKKLKLKEITTINLQVSDIYTLFKQNGLYNNAEQIAAKETNITKRNPILRRFHFIKRTEQMKKKMMNEKKRRLRTRRKTPLSIPGKIPPHQYHDLWLFHLEQQKISVLVFTIL